MSRTLAEELVGLVRWPVLTRVVRRSPEQFWLVLILLVVSMTAHFMWLSYPHQVVFDEVHFGKFVTAYCCTGERFFDIHPPHAKLLIAGAAYLTGFREGHPFASIGQSYGSISPLGLRLLPALTGTALPLAAFILLQQLGASRAAAFFGGAVVVFDNALTVQSRLISLDGLLLLSVFLSLSLWLAAGRSGGRQQLALLAGAGALAGLAVGVKFTGLVALGMLGVLWLIRLWQSRGGAELKRWLTAGALMLLSALLVYAVGWALHFALLDQPGPGDAWRVPHWESPLLVSFVKETVELHKIMFDANYGLSADHPDASRWWEWPLMRTPVFYWHLDGADGRVGSIYLLGNPLVWWGSTVLLACVVADLAWRGLFSQKKLALAGLPLIWIPLLGYVASLAPLVRVPRALFMYHYFVPLIFALLAVVLWLDVSGFFARGDVRNQPRHYFIALAVVAVFFIVFSPLTYGFMLSPALADRLFWLPTWR